MNLKELRISTLAKIIFVSTLLILILTKTPIWSYLKSGLMPMIVAFVVAYILDYSVRLFELRLKLSRGFSIFISVILFLTLIGILGVVIVPKIISTVTSLIVTISSVNLKFNFDFIEHINFENVALKQIQESLINTITPILQKLTNFTGTAVLFLVGGIQKITSGLISFMISFVIAIYILVEKMDLLARAKRLVYAYLTDTQAKKLYYVLQLSDKLFRDFVIGKLIDSTIIGFLTYFLLLLFSFEYAVIIALFVGITNMIPYFGPFIGSIPAAIITLIANPDQPIQVVYILLLILAIQQLDGLVIGPFILGDSVGVSAFWIITAVTVGGATFGVLGMFLGVPACVLIKTLIEEDVERKLNGKGYENFEINHIKVKKTQKFMRHK